MAVTFNQVGDGQWKLDVCGYACPHPQMYTKKAMQKLASGDTLTVARGQEGTAAAAWA